MGEKRLSDVNQKEIKDGIYVFLVVSVTSWQVHFVGK